MIDFENTYQNTVYNSVTYSDFTTPVYDSSFSFLLLFVGVLALYFLLYNFYTALESAGLLILITIFILGFIL